MDLFNAFAMGIPIERKTISGGSTNGRIVTEYENPNYTEDVVPEKTTEYARKHVERIREEVARVSIFHNIAEKS